MKTRFLYSQNALLPFQTFIRAEASSKHSMCLLRWVSFKGKYILLPTLEGCWRIRWTTVDIYSLRKHPPLALLIYVRQFFSSSFDRITVLMWQLVTWGWSSRVSQRGWSEWVLGPCQTWESLLQRGVKGKLSRFEDKGATIARQSFNEAAWLGLCLFGRFF